jgi:hypothetical protein
MRASRWLAMTPASRPGRSVPFARQGAVWEVGYAGLLLNPNESSYVNAHTLFPGWRPSGGILRG